MLKEIRWLTENKEKLEIREIEKLEEYNFFEQVHKGAFNMKGTAFVKMCEEALNIYEHHNNTI